MREAPTVSDGDEQGTIVECVYHFWSIVEVEMFFTKIETFRFRTDGGVGRNLPTKLVEIN